MESTFGHMPLGHLRPTGHLPLTITVDDICHQYLTLTLTLTLNINPNTNYILNYLILTPNTNFNPLTLMTLTVTL